jgi:hypothetical protein
MQPYPVSFKKEHDFQVYEIKAGTAQGNNRPKMEEVLNVYC